MSYPIELRYNFMQSLPLKWSIIFLLHFAQVVLCLTYTGQQSMSCHSLFFMGRIMNLALYTCSIISYTSFAMVNCYSLIIASFIEFFSSSLIISCTHGGLHPSRWIYRSLKVSLTLGSFRFMFIELSSLVLRNKSHPSFLVGGCS